MSITNKRARTKQTDNPLLEYQDGYFLGKHPKNLDISDIEAAGHSNDPLAKIIRKKCLDCCVFQKAEVRKCTATDCSLWPYRMGKNPFHSAKVKNHEQL